MTVDFQALLKNRINLRQIPFSERGSRLLLFQENDHFAVRLAERWFKSAGKLSAYRQRPPIIEDWAFTDEDGEVLPCQVTTYPHCVEILTSLGVFSLTFLDSETLYVALPPARCGVSFRARLDQAKADRRGGVLRLTGNIRRNTAYTTNAPILSNVMSDAGDSCHQVHLRMDASGGDRGLLLNITPRLGFNRWVPRPQDVLEAAEKRWKAWFEAVPPVLEAYQRQYYYAWWIMRVGLLSTRYYTTREVMTPSKSYYIGAWQWDSFFHALA